MIYFPLYPKMGIEFRYLDPRVCSFQFSSQYYGCHWHRVEQKCQFG